MMCLSNTVALKCGQLFYDVDIEFRKPRKTLYSLTTLFNGAKGAADVTSPKYLFANPDGNASSKALYHQGEGQLYFAQPGRYVVPYTAAMKGDYTASPPETVTVPSQSTIADQFADIWCSTEDSATVTPEYDPGAATVGLSEHSHIMTQVGSTDNAASTALNAGSIVIETKKPDTTVDLTKDSSGADSQFWNSSDGWGDLWDIASDVADVVSKAAPYVLEVASWLFDDALVEYRRRRKNGMYRMFHENQYKCPQFYVIDRLQRYNLLPEHSFVLAKLSVKEQLELSRKPEEEIKRYLHIEGPARNWLCLPELFGPQALELRDDFKVDEGEIRSISKLVPKKIIDTKCLLCRKQLTEENSARPGGRACIQCLGL
jgi:hypothetical protein